MKYREDYEKVKGDKEKFIFLIKKKYNTKQKTAERRFYDIRKVIKVEYDKKRQKRNSKKRTERQRWTRFREKTKHLPLVIREPISQKRLEYPAQLKQKPNILKVREFEDMRKHKQTIKRSELKRYGFKEMEINWLEDNYKTVF